MSADEEFVALLERLHALLHEVFKPAGVLMYLGNAHRHLNGRSVAQAIRERDVSGLTSVADLLDRLADGNLS